MKSSFRPRGPRSPPKTRRQRCACSRPMTSRADRQSHSTGRYVPCRPSDFSVAPTASRPTPPRRASHCADSAPAARAAHSCCSTACHSTIRSAAGSHGRNSRATEPGALKSYQVAAPPLGATRRSAESCRSSPRRNPFHRCTRISPLRSCPPRAAPSVRARRSFPPPHPRAAVRRGCSAGPSPRMATRWSRPNAAERSTRPRGAGTAGSRPVGAAHRETAASGSRSTRGSLRRLAATARRSPVIAAGNSSRRSRSAAGPKPVSHGTRSRTHRTRPSPARSAR